MRKREIAIKPAETLRINFPNGTYRDAVFNIEALMILTEEFGDIAEIARNLHSQPYAMGAKILYSGMKALDAGATMDEANSIMVGDGGGLLLLNTMMEMFMENFGQIDPEELKKNLIPIVNQQLTQRPKVKYKKKSKRNRKRKP